MSQHPTPPEQHPTPPEQPDEGTFLGGEFGTSDNAEDASTAQQAEVDQDRAAHLVDPAASPAGTGELLTQPAEPDAFDSDVEGTSTEPSPGERNEPL